MKKALTLLIFGILTTVPFARGDARYRLEHSMLDGRFETKCENFDADSRNPLPSKTRWGVCVTKAYSDLDHKILKNSPNVLYLFHPLMATEGIFSNLRSFQRELLSAMESPPIIISVSFYDKNFLNIKHFATIQSILDPIYLQVFGIKSSNFLLFAVEEQSRTSGLLNIFIDEVMPWIEKSNRVEFDSQKGERQILGISMGGFNAIQVALNPRSGKLFKKAVIFDALNFEANPFNPNDFEMAVNFNFMGPEDPDFGTNPMILANTRIHNTLAKHEENHKTQARRYAAIVGSMVDQYFVDVPNKIAVFMKEHHPFTLTEKLNKMSPDMYIVTSTSDRPFFKPNCAFAATLRAWVKNKKLKSNIFFSETTHTHGLGLSFHQPISESVTEFLGGKVPTLNIETMDASGCFLSEQR